MQRPPTITNEEEWQVNSQAIVHTAQAILKRELGIIEGARKLSSYRFKVKAKDDKDFIFFVGLDSETDQLPIGDVLRQWNPDVLKQKKAEIEGYERSIEQEAFAACNNLITKYRA